MLNLGFFHLKYLKGNSKLSKKPVHVSCMLKMSQSIEHSDEIK